MVVRKILVEMDYGYSIQRNSRIAKVVLNLLDKLLSCEAYPNLSEMMEDVSNGEPGAHVDHV